jgi:hypothetical protein
MCWGWWRALGFDRRWVFAPKYLQVVLEGIVDVLHYKCVESVKVLVGVSRIK